MMLTAADIRDVVYGLVTAGWKGGGPYAICIDGQWFTRDSAEPPSNDWIPESLRWLTGAN